jgi:hypothetical protein
LFELLDPGLAVNMAVVFVAVLAIVLAVVGIVIARTGGVDIVTPLLARI